MKIYTIPVGSFQANCYVVASEEGNAVVIDPGSDGERIAKGMQVLGQRPRCILLTHGHHDHIGGVRHLLKEYPDTPVCIGAGDVEMLRDVEKNLAATRYSDTSAFDGLQESRALEDGETVEVDELTFTVISTPGHTKGGVCYKCENLLFTGDTLFNGSVGRTDLFGGDFEALTRSVQRLYALEGDCTVLPGHGEPTTLGAERGGNPYVRAE